MTHDVPGSKVITLSSNGCLVGNGLRDCGAACQDPSRIFENTATLHNCLHYPLIVQAISEQALEHGSGTIARDYGISAANVSGATNAIQQCLTDYASTTPKPSKYSSTLCSGSTQALCYDHTNICESVYAPVIEDIAGVGIYTSYWMQNGIALVAFALLRLFDFWIYYITIAVLGCIRGLEKAKVKADWAKQYALRHRVPNLISSLFEFQKAQCFFMIAVQVAAIIIAKRGGFDAKTLQQLSNSYSAITLVAICGYLPVVLTLLNLHGAGQDSWYIIALSTITVVIAGITAFTTKRFVVLDKFRSSRTLLPATQELRYPRRVNTASLKQRTTTGFSTLSRLSVVPTYYSNLDMKTKHIINNIIYGCVWILFLFFYCRAIYLLSNWINHQSGVIGPSTWSFGQIVGITVWVPSLIQYLYLETRGMVAWFEQHVAGDHHVVHYHPTVEP
ncbi:MAG: hypothetical protein L6R42_009494 [Xanthoria sp. 1 TBL-2021]|nr:MAG: hypothetical protein L6R42_009494 [Xanthoria sp. 1 TBL-2021]